MMILAMVALFQAQPAATPERKLKVIAQPNWIERATGVDLSVHYPPQAQNIGVSGQTAMRCTVADDGKMADCELTKEIPTGQGFGQAALKVARYFRVAATDASGEVITGSQVVLPISWRMVKNFEAKPQRVRDPAFTEAEVDLDCRVINGFLDNCLVIRTQPAETEMATRALQIAAELELTSLKDRRGRLILPLRFTPQPLPAR